MKRFIRFKGLVAFVIIIAVFSMFWFFFVDGIVKSLIQKYGIQAVGAKVDVEAADLSLFPARLELKHLQVTDPDSADKASPIKAALLSFLPSISRFHVNVDIRGTLADYAIDLTSDLDRAFAKAAGRAVSKQAAGFEKKLKEAVMAKVGGPLQSTSKDMVGLNSIGKELSGRLSLGNSLLGNLKGLKGKGGLKLPF